MYIPFCVTDKTGTNICCESLLYVFIYLCMNVARQP